MARRRRSRLARLKVSRDTILFVTGLAGIGYETLINGGDRPTLLILFGAMVGLPAFLRTDEIAHDTSEGSDKSPPPEDTSK